MPVLRRPMASRLRQMTNAETITVHSRTSAAVEGTGTEYSVTRSQMTADEQLGEFGQVYATVVNVFWIYRESLEDALPTITEAHVIRDANNVRFEVIRAVDQGGQGGRLAVITNRDR